MAWYLCGANAISDDTGLGYSEMNNAGAATGTDGTATATGTGIETIDDDKPGLTESKVDIIAR